jgi:pyruvate dehydrogenase E2 component (dihydrolipoamide acetyltransferase)
MKGISYALKQQPLLNSALIENEIVIFEEINIGFAVALEGAALIVPVITDVDKKSIWEIAQEGNELAERARLGKLKLEEVSKGTFTLTNAGMLGIDVACGIINQPQTAILTTGRFIEKPAFHKGNIVPRSFMSATISYDHRVLSGEPVGYFLQALSKVLENPGNFDGFV